MDANSDRLANKMLHCEDPARPDGTCSQLPWSLDSISRQLDPDLRPVFASINGAFRIKEPGVGLVALSHEICLDLAAFEDGDAPIWSKKLKQLHDCVAPLAEFNHVKDLAALRSQSARPLRKFLTPFAFLAPAQGKMFRRIRGLLTLCLLSRGETLSVELAGVMGHCLAGKILKNVELEKVTADQLRRVRAPHSPESPESKFLTFLIEGIDSGLKNPFPDPRALHGVPVATPKYSDQAKHAGATTKPPRKTPEQTTDLLKGILAEEGIAGTKKFSGIPDIYGCLQPFELELVAPSIVETWRLSATKEEGLAALLTLFTRCMPQHFDRIPLSATFGAGIWVDLTQGCICWNLDEAISRRKSEKPFLRESGNRYFRIPLPAEVSADLRSRAEARGPVSTLADLLEDRGTSLGTKTKRLLRSLALTSHRPTLSRLADSWSRYLLHECRDEAYAAALGMDFTIGSRSNFNYVMFRGSRVAQILDSAYKNIGFSGGVTPGGLPDMGSRRLPCSTVVSELIRNLLHTVRDVIVELPNRTDLITLMAAHNQISTYLYVVFKFISASRVLAEEVLTFLRVDWRTGVAQITDKRFSPFHEWRYILLPETLLEWLHLYRQWVLLVAYRIAYENKKLALAIASTLENSNQTDFIPMFFTFKGDKISPIGSSELSQTLGKSGIDENAGRHFINELLLENPIDSAAWMAWCGRGNPGQELAGRWSAAIPMESIQKCAAVIEKWLGQLDLPSPPHLMPRRLGLDCGGITLEPFVPKFLQYVPESLSNPESKNKEPCPIHAGDVWRASVYPKLFQFWRGQAPPNSLAAVALSLIFEDGVVLRDELHGAIEEMCGGGIYQVGAQFFVDVRSPALGIRRVWLSSITMNLLSRIKHDQRVIDWDNADREIVSFMNKALPGATDLGINSLQRCMQSYLFLHIPTLLHSWIGGLQFARTSRPQTAARQLLGCCEHPSLHANFRRRQHLGFNDFDTLMREAKQEVDKGGADLTVLKRLGERLTSIVENYPTDSLEWFRISYASHLCKIQKNLNTVMRYDSANRPFLSSVVAQMSDGSLEQVNWLELVSSCLAKNDDEQSDDAPLHAAINHCLTWLGVDLKTNRRQGPPACAFVYADIITPREAEVALSLLKKEQKSPGDIFHRAAVALNLSMSVEIRWDALAHLRLCDFFLDDKHPHFAITREFGGGKKSKNAMCVLELTDPELVRELRAIFGLRMARFDGDKAVPLFGNDMEVRTVDSLDQLHDLITEALVCASGSSTVRIHSTRGSGLTRKTGSLLDPEQRKFLGGSLSQRQAPFIISTRSAHGNPNVSIENYALDMDRWRQVWVARVNKGIGSRTSSRFASEVTGLAAATFRKRASRAQEKHCPFDFDEYASAPVGIPIKKLEDLVLLNQQSVGSLAERATRNELLGLQIYLGLRILRVPESEAQCAAGLSISTARAAEHDIKSFQQLRDLPFSGSEDISRTEFIDEALKSGLVIAMKATKPHELVVRRLTESVGVVGEPWQLRNTQEFLDAASWTPPLSEANIEVFVALKLTERSRVDHHRITSLNDAGIKAYTRPSRYFPRGAGVLVKFMRPADQSNGVRSRHSHALAFLATTALLTLGLLSK